MDNRLERQRLVGHREIEPDTIIINGIEYRKVVPQKEELTLTSIIRLWENGFTAKWEKKENRNCDVYNREIVRLVQMIEEWLPPASPASFGYREMLLRKFR